MCEIKLYKIRKSIHIIHLYDIIFCSTEQCTQSRIESTEIHTGHLANYPLVGEVINCKDRQWF